MRLSPAIRARSDLVQLQQAPTGVELEVVLATVISTDSPALGIGLEFQVVQPFGVFAVATDPVEPNLNRLGVRYGVISPSVVRISMLVFRPLAPRTVDITFVSNLVWQIDV